MLSCVPGFVTAEQVKWVYYFKLFRYSRVKILFSEIEKFSQKIQDAMNASLQIRNVFSVIT